MPDSSLTSSSGLVRLVVGFLELTHLGINWLCYTRLEMEDKGSAEANLKHKMDFIEGLKLAPLAIHTDVSTEQHYELPTEFFLLSLGRRLKYSGCFFPPGCKDLVCCCFDLLFSW